VAAAGGIGCWYSGLEPWPVAKVLACALSDLELVSTSSLIVCGPVADHTVQFERSAGRQGAKEPEFLMELEPTNKVYLNPIGRGQ
jgi:hypothetical protein